MAVIRPYPDGHPLEVAALRDRAPAEPEAPTTADDSSGDPAGDEPGP